MIFFFKKSCLALYKIAKRERIKKLHVPSKISNTIVGLLHHTVERFVRIRRKPFSTISNLFLDPFTGTRKEVIEKSNTFLESTSFFLLSGCRNERRKVF